MSIVASWSVAPGDPDRAGAPAARPGPTLLDANLRVPTRSVGVHRSRILQRLRVARDARIVSVVAPAGYGKTTVLAQLAAGLPGRVAWVTVDDGANDAIVLLTYVAAAFDRVETVAPSVFERLGTPDVPLRDVMAELLGGLAGATEPVLLVLDDAHRLHDAAALQVLTSLVEHLPSRVRVIIAGREAPALPFPRWLAEEVILRLGPDDLAMTDDEATRLLTRRGAGLAPAAVRQLVDGMHGWPALLALGAADAKDLGDDARSDGPVLSASVVDYLRSEVIAPLPAADAELLLGSSMLERLTGSECDAILDRRASARTLVRLARAALLDDVGDGWFRLHPVLRAHFLAELAAHEPEVIPERHRRAAIWLEARGAIDEAVEHAFASGDLDLAASMVGRALVPDHWGSRHLAARSWLGRFTDDELAGRPWLAVDGAWQELHGGDVARTERLAGIADRGSFDGPPPDGTPSFDMGRAMLRAAMCRRGPEDALANALRAVVLDRPGSRWRDLALWTVALARTALGDPTGADAALALAVASAHANRNAGLAWCLLGHRALLAADRLDWAAAEAFLDEGHALTPPAITDAFASATPALAAMARLRAHQGHVNDAHDVLRQALIVRPALTAASPVLSVVSLTGLARAHIAVADAPTAAILLAQARSILRLRPRLGVLGADVTALHESLTSTPPMLARGAASLTTAELHVLALLPFYLSFKEIGQRLGVKATTVKSHALAIYGKLGASSRSEAVELATEAGLLDRLHR